MKTRFFNQTAELFALIGAAGRAAAATEAGRVPSRETLRALSIDPEQFRRIGR